MKAYLIYRKTFTNATDSVKSVCLDLEICKKEIERLDKIEIEFYKNSTFDLYRDTKNWYYYIEKEIVLS